MEKATCTQNIFNLMEKKNKEGNFMIKQKEEGKYIHASFIGKVSMRMKEYIKKPYGRKREKYTKSYIYPHLLDNFKL